MDWSRTYQRERRVGIEDIANSIRVLVRMRDVLFAYCPDIKSKIHGNRCPCPLHNGTDSNFSFNDVGFHCFVCGESGDVITFVQKRLDLPRRFDAMKRINEDMKLGLPIGRAASFTESVNLALQREEAQRREAEKQAWENKYALLMDEYARLDKIRMNSAPGSDEYAEAVKQLTYINYELDFHLQQEPR